LTVASGTVIPPGASCSVSVVVTSIESPQVINTIPAGSLSTSVGSNPSLVTATLTVSPVADLAITKTASTSTPNAGSTFSYTIVISNAGPSTATGASFADTLPAGLGTLTGVTSQVSAGASTANFVATANSLNGSTTIPPLGRVTITFQVTAAASASGALANVATVTPPAGTTDPTPGNNSSMATVTVTLADVSTTVALPATAVAGTTVSGTVTYTNNTNVPTLFTSTVVINGVSTTTTQTIPAFGTVSLPISVFVGTQGATVTANASGSTVPETTLANNSASQSITAQKANASLSGRVWLDSNRDKKYTAGVDLDLAGWKVELLRGATVTTVVGTATTGADGRYSIDGQAPGNDYSIRFKNPADQVVVSTPYNQSTSTFAGSVSTGTTSFVAGSNVVGGAIGTVTLYAGENIAEQNLPIDPSGVVYDAVTRNPVAGAKVTLLGPDGNPVAGASLLQGVSTMTTDASGIYQFDLLPTTPPTTGRYRLLIEPPQGYKATPATQGGVSQPGIAPNTTQGSINNGVYTPPTGGAFVNIQPTGTQPSVGVNGASAVGLAGTQYFLEFNITVGGANQSSGARYNHIPLDPLVAGALLVTKVGDKSVAEVADSVRYFIRMRNTGDTPITSVKLDDLLPAGFRYILSTSRLNSVTLADPAGGVGRALTFDIGTIAANSTVELTYYVRLGVGSQQGDGINRASARGTGVNGSSVASNSATFKVTVQGGVLSNDGCIIGKVYVDCDGTHTQNNESGSRELGIPGVRLVLLDGTYIITDNEGKYSICGVKPQTHVIKVDRSTLPKGSRLLPSSNRNAGVGDSIFVDLKGGELARADFIEGSCSPEVLDQVKARRALGGVLVPEKEVKPDLRIDNRPSEAQQQILPSVRPDAPANSGASAPGGARP
jgi:large repetitive protein